MASYSRKLTTIFASQPTRRFIAEDHRQKKQDGWKALHAERYDIGGVSRQMEKAAIVDPKCQHNPHGDKQLVDSGKAASDGTWCIFGNYK
jgi:hypothetical protein